MSERNLIELLYRFIARLDDDPLVPLRIREHAHLLRQEMQRMHGDLDNSLPPSPRGDRVG